MIIPAQSQLLIKDVNYASLILGALLAGSGINVLLVSPDDVYKDGEEISFNDEYINELLIYYGFDINNTNLYKQASQLLAKSLCNIIWSVRIKQEINPQTFLLANKQQQVKHQAQFVINADELLLENSDATLKNIAFLYWKLKGFLANECDTKILDYHPTEKQIVQNYYLEKATKPSYLKSLFKKIIPSQDFLTLKESKLNLHLSQHRGLEAGDLLPNLKVFDEKLKQETSFYNWCKFGNYSLIMVGYVSKHNLFQTARWIKSNYPIQLFYLPPSERNQHIFDFFKIIEGEKKTLIIRPDRYIGLINDRIDLEIIQSYLSDFLQLNTQVSTISSKALGDGSIDNYP